MGSHRRQVSGDSEPLPATIDAARRHVRRRQATSRQPPELPSKQRVAGSNPAGRASLTRRNVYPKRVQEDFPSLRAFRVPERLGLLSDLPSAALAFLPISLARAR